MPTISGSFNGEDRIEHSDTLMDGTYPFTILCKHSELTLQIEYMSSPDKWTKLIDPMNSIHPEHELENSFIVPAVKSSVVKFIFIRDTPGARLEYELNY